MKKLGYLLCLTLLGTLAKSQDVGLNQPMYEFDTLIYRHYVFLKTSEPAYHFPPGCFLHEYVVVKPAGGLDFRFDGGGSMYIASINTGFQPKTMTRQMNDGSWHSVPIKYGDQNWRNGIHKLPMATAKAVNGAEGYLYFFSLQPLPNPDKKMTKPVQKPAYILRYKKQSSAK